MDYRHLEPSAYPNISGMREPSSRVSNFIPPAPRLPLDPLERHAFLDESEMLKRQRERLEAEIELLRRKRTTLCPTESSNAFDDPLYERRPLNEYDKRDTYYEFDRHRADYDISRMEYDRGRIDREDYDKRIDRDVYDKRIDREDYDKRIDRDVYDKRIDRDVYDKRRFEYDRFDYNRSRIDYDKSRTDYDRSRLDYDEKRIFPSDEDFTRHNFVAKDYGHSGGYANDAPRRFDPHQKDHTNEASSYKSGYTQDLPRKWKYSEKDNELNSVKKKKGGPLTEFLCKECNITCNTQQVMDSHIAGKNHAKKLEKLGLPPGTATIVEVPAKPLFPSKSEQMVEDEDNYGETGDGTEEYCDICHKGFTGSYKLHARSKYHKKCALTCNKCYEVFETLEDFDAHNWENHRDDKKENKADQAKEKEKENIEPKGLDLVEETEGQYCKLCLVFFHGDFVTRLAHCSSKMHLEKAKEQMGEEGNPEEDTQKEQVTAEKENGDAEEDAKMEQVTTEKENSNAEQDAKMEEVVNKGKNGALEENTKK